MSSELSSRDIAKNALEDKYAAMGIEIRTSYLTPVTVKSVKINFPEHQGFTPAEIWLDMMDSEGEYLPACCANISRIRDILISSVRNGGMVEANALFEIYYLLKDHGCFDDENKIEPTDPLEYLKNLWLAIESDTKEEKPISSNPNNLFDAIDIIYKACAHISWSKVFESHPHEHTEASNQLELARMLPALHTLSKNIDALNSEVEAYAVYKDDEVVEIRSGYALFRTEETANMLAKAYNEHEDVEETSPKCIVKRVKVSLKDGIQLNPVIDEEKERQICEMIEKSLGDDAPQNDY